MRCITAIWPAGPPKLSAAILAQTRTASPNGMPCAGAWRWADAVVMWGLLVGAMLRRQCVHNSASCATIARELCGKYDPGHAQRCRATAWPGLGRSALGDRRLVERR